MVKAYAMTTGCVFGLMVIAHVWRAVADGPGLIKDPGFIALTAAAAALAVGAWRVVRSEPK